MAKFNFFNQAESFISQSYISQLYGNATKKTGKWRYFITSNEKKNSGKELNNIEARLTERK